MVSSVSPETEHTPAKAMTVSRDSPAAPVNDSSLLWRAPEGPEGTGGLRGAAPNEVRSPSLGGRTLRRPKHQRGHKQHDNQAHKNRHPQSDVGPWWS